MDRMISDAEVMEIGRKLRELREKLGYTQQEFANKLFWDVSSYQKIESGKTLMTLDKAIQLHREYKVDLNYFVAVDSFDGDDLLMQVLMNSPKEKFLNMTIKLLEYLIYLMELSQKEGHETDIDTGR